MNLSENGMKINVFGRRGENGIAIPSILATTQSDSPTHIPECA